MWCHVKPICLFPSLAKCQPIVFVFAFTPSRLTRWLLPRMSKILYNSKPRVQPQSGSTNTDIRPSSRWRLCPAPPSSSVICCLGCRDSLGGHTPSSPYNSSRTTQNALSSASPDPPMSSPLYSPSTGCLCGIQNPAAGKQGCKGIHTNTPRGHCPGLHTHKHTFSAFLPRLVILILRPGCVSHGSHCLSLCFCHPLLIFCRVSSYALYAIIFITIYFNSKVGFC